MLQAVARPLRDKLQTEINFHGSLITPNEQISAAVRTDFQQRLQGDSEVILTLCLDILLNLARSPGPTGESSNRTACLALLVELRGIDQSSLSLPPVYWQNAAQQAVVLSKAHSSDLTFLRNAISELLIKCVTLIHSGDRVHFNSLRPYLEELLRLELMSQNDTEGKRALRSVLAISRLLYLDSELRQDVELLEDFCLYCGSLFNTALFAQIENDPMVLIGYGLIEEYEWFIVPLKQQINHLGRNYLGSGTPGGPPSFREEVDHPSEFIKRQTGTMGMIGSLYDCVRAFAGYKDSKALDFGLAGKSRSVPSPVLSLKRAPPL